MNIYATRVLTAAPVFVFAFVILIYALIVPYMVYNLHNQTISVYVDKVCVDNVCENENPLINAQIGKFLMGMYIIMIVLSFICFVLYVAGNKYYNWVGIVALIGAVTLVVAIPVIISQSALILPVLGKKMNFKPEFTTTSILVVIACSLIIVKQIFNNRILHSIVGQ